jgi:hypothetical protein
MKRFALAALIALVACSSSDPSSSSPSSETFDELGVSESAAKPDVLRGKLRAGEFTGLEIVEARGPEDHYVVAVELAESDLAGEKEALLRAAEDGEFYVRGKIEKRDTGESVGGSRIQREVLVADVVGRIISKDTTATGILRLVRGGHLIEKRVGSGDDSDDAGSIVADFGEVSVELRALTNKKVRARGTKIFAYKGAVHGSLIAEDRIVVRSLARAR